MTPIKNSVRLAAIGTGAAYSAVLYLAGVQLDGWPKHVLSLLPTLAALGVVAFDKWLWRFGPVSKLHSRPRINGLWKAELIPHADSHIPAGGNTGPIEAFIVIEQSFWSIAVSLFTAESASRSRTSRFLTFEDSAVQTLSFLYDNTPRVEHRARSLRHIGACELSVPQGQPTALSGEYFTDRLTLGEIRLSFVDRTTNYADFASAKQHQTP